MRGYDGGVDVTVDSPIALESGHPGGANPEHCLYLPKHCLHWVDSSCVWASEPFSATQRFARTLTGLAPLDFALSLPSDAAESLSIRFATWARRNTPSVFCQLLDDSGATIRQVEVLASSIRDGAFTKVADLRGLSFAEQRSLRIRLTSPRATHENGFAVWLCDAPLPGPYPVPRLERFRGDRFFLYPAEPRAADPAPLVALLGTQTTDRLKLRLVLEAIDRGFPGSHVRLSGMEPLEELWDEACKADVVLLTEEAAELDGLCFELHRRGICTVFVEAVAPGVDASLRSPPTRAEAWVRPRRRCRFTLLPDGRLLDNLGESAEEELRPAQSGGLQSLASAVRLRWSPEIIVVSPAPDDDESVRALVENCFSQLYPGPVTLLLIGRRPAALAASMEATELGLDRSGPRTLRWVGDWRDAIDALAETGKHHRLVVLSRSARCSPNFLAAHALEHADGRDAVVMGETVLEANDSPLRGLPVRTDAVQANGFLNCTSSNVSFPQRLATALAGLVEALVLDDPGRRRIHELACAHDAYVAGYAFRFNDQALSRQSAGSMLGEREARELCAAGLPALAASRPQFALAARRWLTYVKAEAASRPVPARRRRALNILSYRWHVAHQYELQKLPHRFTLATHIGENRFIDQWSLQQRPLRPNVRMRPSEEIDPADYDLAILHFDEHVNATHLSNGRLDPSWGEPFAWMLGLPNIPKIAVCHGTPAFVGQFAADSGPISTFEAHEDERRGLVEALAAADVQVVCNSWQAKKEWGFHTARVIWHGFDPQEFPPTTYDGQVLALEPDLQRPHYRGAYEALAVAGDLQPHVRISTLNHGEPPIERRDGNGYGDRSFRAYIDELRRYSVYLNTTLRSPMPRSRGEAMMMGLAPICIRNHDAELFIDPGVNGFYADAPGELADFINHLFLDDERVRRLGQAARRTALDLFNHDRFLAAWTSAIEEVVRTR